MFCLRSTSSATTTTQTHLSEHVREYIERISPAVDVGAVTQRISRAIASAVPAPVLYHNYVVGECNDLIFGVSLGDYAHARNLPDGEIPKIVRLCIAEVDARGLECEGIYRVTSYLSFKACYVFLILSIGFWAPCDST
jgi:hypothetical protein